MIELTRKNAHEEGASVWNQWDSRYKILPAGLFKLSAGLSALLQQGELKKLCQRIVALHFFKSLTEFW